jgi:hypothetical protein
MAYFQNDDFNLLIQDVNLQQIINQNEAIRQQAELVAIGEARSYLIQKYLFDEELLKSGDDRDSQLLNYMIDLVLYHLHSRIAPRNIPQLRQTRYDNALAWLKMCAMGDVTPKLEERTTEGKIIRWGSVPKNQNNY